MKADHDRSSRATASAKNTMQDYLELWITLARRDWGSLVVIPADRDGSTTEIVTALVDIGQRLSYGPVTAITMNSLEYGSALALADLQQHMERERRRWARTSSAGTVVPSSTPAGGSVATEPAVAAAPGGPAAASDPTHPAQPDPAEATVEPDVNAALLVMPPARVIISVPPVVTEPLGLAAVEGADAIVLAIHMYRSRVAEVRRTIELVGRQRLTGCFLVR